MASSGADSLAALEAAAPAAAGDGQDGGLAPQHSGLQLHLQSSGGLPPQTSAGSADGVAAAPSAQGAAARRSVSWADNQPEGRTVVLVAVREFEPRRDARPRCTSSGADPRHSETEDSEAGDTHRGGCCTLQ